VLRCRELPTQRSWSARAWLPASLTLALFLPAHSFGAGGFEAVQAAIAVLSPTAGNGARGVVRFAPHPEGVELIVKVEGLPQGTRHGFHVHEFGDCSASDASSAGEHYDPTNNKPGRHQHGMRPLGDLDDLRADAQGKVEVRFVARALSITGTHPILGRALVLHAGFENPSDPMSDAGARIACGTIGVVAAPAAASTTAP
jgi:superoxide dismutase, Cu-Zn family